MSRGERSPSPQPMLRLTMLLVLTVLTGLVAMHGLGSATPALADKAPSHAVHQMQTTATEHPCVCPDDDGSADRHGSHADQMCASAAVPGAVFIPALAASAPNVIATTAPSAAAATPCEPAGARAPPTLAQLQLLRI
ncbi:DUF6153 family protein [Streptomyces sp. V1I1]|uniref:DUF6153 family protein n=1 Tax=Streptomyces sp. V1I1 TaxID=3042272 RepID=UPI00277D91C5|nr:DUF6153 family protein [Streptomyces sp. V1I1]MDQ0939297.1 hypothetical protein [Streptomyces sp. V1I1]